jgi:CheY-like chemotaxis protein
VPDPAFVTIDIEHVSIESVVWATWVNRTWPHPYERAIALVVENDPWIRLVMCDLLTQAGYRVAEASNGSSALRLSQPEPVALVLLNLLLAELSGLSVLAELRAARLRRTSR